MSNKIKKLRAQIKSNAYYIFWGVATVAVIAGQVYIGIGYRLMTRSLIDLTEVFTLIRDNDLKTYQSLGYKPIVIGDKRTIKKKFDPKIYEWLKNN